MTGIGLNGSLLLGAQALSAQRIAIETIGNNIANVNTPGYARQRANIATDVAIRQGAGEQGMGAYVSNIEQLRSSLLDGLVQQSLGNQGFYDNQADLASTIQSALGEQFTSTSNTSASSGVTSSSGAIQDALSGFFNALQNLASTPTDPTARQLVAQQGSVLAQNIGGAYQRLQQAQSDIAADTSGITGQINQMAADIATLNQQIKQTEASSGMPANDLRDARTAKIEQLSQMVNINATTQSDGTVSVALADNPSVVLVNESDGGGAGATQSLSASYNAGALTPLTISASATGALGTGIPSSGSLGAHLDAANNIIGSPASSGNSGVLGALDGVANQLRTLINAQHALGTDANGNPGGAFFDGTGAADLAVDPAILKNPSLIAAGNGSGVLDGSNALALSQLQSQSGIIPAFQAIVTNLGATVGMAQDAQTTQDQVTKQLQTQRDSVSGVSMDEEMTNLVNFQQAYAASARFITVISGLFDTLVNKTQ